MQLAALDTFAQRHHGLINLAAASHIGISRSAWYRAIDQQRFEPVHPGVARLWGSPTTLQQRALAAVWACGEGAMTSHRTSAALWGIERPDGDPIDIIIPGRRRHPRLPGVELHRPRDLIDLRPILRQRVPTTNPLRMLLDLGAVDEGAVEDAMYAVMISAVASPRAIRAALLRHTRKGRHGVTALRTALESWAGDEAPPDSELETLMAAFARDHDLPPLRFHAIVAGYEVDFLVEGTTVVLECDGWGTHGLDRDQFEFDRIRDADLLAAGYPVVHFTWRRLMTAPQQVATQIRTVIERWHPGFLATASGSIPSPKARRDGPR